MLLEWLTRFAVEIHAKIGTEFCMEWGALRSCAWCKNGTIYQTDCPAIGKCYRTVRGMSRVVFVASESVRRGCIVSTEVGSLQTHSWQSAVFGTRVLSATHDGRLYDDSNLPSVNG